MRIFKLPAEENRTLWSQSWTEDIEDTSPELKEEEIIEEKELASTRQS